MTQFDERKKAFENKFAHDEELMFKVRARKRKLLGIWAAELIGMNEESGLNYAIDVINYGVETGSPEDVKIKILSDLKEGGIEVSEIEYNKKAMEFEAIAKQQILQ